MKLIWVNLLVFIDGWFKIFGFLWFVCVVDFFELCVKYKLKENFFY